MILRIILALLLVLWTSPAWATVSFVQVNEAFDASSGGSMGIVVPSVSVGSVVLVFCQCATGQNATGITDTLGNTYFIISSSWSGNGFAKRAFVATIANGGSSPTILCAYDGGVSLRGISVAEFAKTGSSWSFDGENHASATVASSPGPSVAITTTATDLLIGFNVPQLVETVPPSGWTRACVGCVIRMDYKIGATAGSNDYQPTWTGVNTIDDQILAITEVGAGPPTTNRTRGRIQ